ncbi:MAG: peptidoglycan-binding protein [Candidatus Taylorbacteria bacterium]|nr:peptidoglycan-binding protein [Candidatus Taylorbacteria bacterium]
MHTSIYSRYAKLFVITSVIIGLNPHIAVAIDYTISSIPSSFTFQRNLKQGDIVDPDVKYLQMILNSRPETKVAESGPGSISEPTTLFGSLTKAAVMKFQEIYRSDVLTPAGLTSPTGTVGAFTRTKLNSLLSTQRLVQNARNISTQTNSNTGTLAVSATPGIADGFGIVKAGTGARLLDASSLNRGTTTYGMQVYALPKATVTSSGDGVRVSTLQINGLSTYQAKPNLVMSIFGSNFTNTGNNVFLGPVHVGTFNANTTGTQITFQIPEYMPRGFYQLGVSNIYGTTTTSNDTYLILERPTSTDAMITRPVISTILPSYTRYINDVILITGKNFTLNNTIATNLGDVKNIVSMDGNNISFLVGALPFYAKAQSEYKGSAINLIIKVANENGTSTDLVNHVISFPLTTTVNTAPQATPLAAINGIQTSSTKTGSSTASTTTSVPGGSSGSKSSTSGTNSSNIMDYLKPVASPGGDLLRQLDPNFKKATDPVVNTNVSQFQTITGGGQNSSGGGNSSSIGGAALGLGVAAGVGALAGGGTGGKMVDYFGGTITRTTFCSCSGKTLITVDDYATNNQVTMMYDPTISKLNMNFNIWSTGAYVIGGFMSGGGECQVYNGESCDTQGTAQYTIDNVRGIGTSKY